MWLPVRQCDAYVSMARCGPGRNCQGASCVRGWHLAGVEVHHRHEIQRPSVRIVCWLGVEVHETLDKARRVRPLGRQVLQGTMRNFSAFWRTARIPKSLAEKCDEPCSHVIQEANCLACLANCLVF